MCLAEDSFFRSHRANDDLSPSKRTKTSRTSSPSPLFQPSPSPSPSSSSLMPLFPFFFFFFVLLWRREPSKSRMRLIWLERTESFFCFSCLFVCITAEKVIRGGGRQQRVCQLVSFSLSLSRSLVLSRSLSLVLSLSLSRSLSSLPFRS